MFVFFLSSGVKQLQKKTIWTYIQSLFGVEGGQLESMSSLLGRDL